MSWLRRSVGMTWLFSSLVYCGCSSGGSNSGGPSDAPSPVITKRGPAPAPATDNAKPDLNSLLSRFKKAKSKPPQQRSRDDFYAIIDLSDKILTANPEPADRGEVISATLEAIGIVTQFEPQRRDLLTKCDRLAEAARTDSASSDLLVSAGIFRALAHFNVERHGHDGDTETNQRLLQLAKEYTSEIAADPRLGQLFYMIGDKLTAAGDQTTALEAWKHCSEVDADGQFGSMAKGKLALIETQGKPPEIAGPTLAGSEIDILEFKGKVVLVDFWATWCGPCVAELPNVKRVYEKYHDKGFEVLAISFDNTKAELSRFVEARKLPWPQIYFDEDGKRTWQNPLGQRYGINSIPATFLVDREGNLQMVGVRGTELEPAVVELLNAATVAGDK